MKEKVIKYVLIVGLIIFSLNCWFGVIVYMPIILAVISYILVINDKFELDKIKKISIYAVFVLLVAILIIYNEIDVYLSILLTILINYILYKKKMINDNKRFFIINIISLILGFIISYMFTYMFAYFVSVRTIRICTSLLQYVPCIIMIATVNRRIETVDIKGYDILLFILGLIIINIIGINTIGKLNKAIEMNNRILEVIPQSNTINNINQYTNAMDKALNSIGDFQIMDKTKYEEHVLYPIEEINKLKSIRNIKSSDLKLRLENIKKWNDDIEKEISYVKERALPECYMDIVYETIAYIISIYILFFKKNRENYY